MKTENNESSKNDEYVLQNTNINQQGTWVEKHKCPYVKSITTISYSESDLLWSVKKEPQKPGQ